MKGMFITFEGPDGAGKTTQIKRLAASLNEAGFDTLITREPGGTAIGDQIRSLLLSPDHQELKDQTEVLLYAASRAQHVHELILPALEQGKIVLCDRFIDASIAYQAHGLGIGEQLVRDINRFASSGLSPDRTYLLDIPETESRRRLLIRSGAAVKEEAQLDRIEQRASEYHRKVRQAFLAIAEQEPERVLVVDAARSEEKIAEHVLQDALRILQAFSAS